MEVAIFEIGAFHDAPELTRVFALNIKILLLFLRIGREINFGELLVNF